MKDSRHILFRTINIVLFAVLFTVVPIIVNLSFNYFSPASWWFNYYSVESTKTEYTSKEDLRFVSDRDIIRPLTFQFSDQLFCTDMAEEVGSIFYSSLDGSSVWDNPVERKQSTWTFLGDKPSVYSQCYLVSNITADVGLGITKKQKYIGGPFYLNIDKK